MNLRPRFLLLTLVLFVVSAIPLWFAVRATAEGIFEQWAQRYTEKQVLYDKSRALQPILREVALSRQMASSPDLVAWAQEPNNADKQTRALAEMERFRQNFTDHSYFIGLLGNQRYYHNNAQNEFAGQEFRYELNRGAAKDAWFYDLIRQQRDIHINVNPDPELGITKLWIDVLIREDGKTLGIAGTGLELKSFLRDVVEAGGEGVTTLFVDHDGAIQLHRNPSLIDYNSISNQNLARKNIDLLFDQAEDRQAVVAAMKTVELGQKRVVTQFVNIDGKRHLAGVTYVPELAWYEITLLDLDALLPISNFTGIVLAYVITLIAVLILFNLALGHFVLKPLRQLNTAMADVEAGAIVPERLEALGAGEIGQLLKRFVRMANAVLDARHTLEAKVQERTLALDLLTKTDVLCELLNRRGMTQTIEAEMARAQRESRRLGILWIDVDTFKMLNDQYGHAVGDRVLQAVAHALRSTLRPYDVAARWGGDEFLVLLQGADQATLDHLGERLQAAVAANTQVQDTSGQTIHFTVSVGGHLAREDEALDDLLQQGDAALYAAKSAGRNCYRASAQLPITGVPSHQSSQ